MPRLGDALRQVDEQISILEKQRGPDTYARSGEGTVGAWHIDKEEAPEGVRLGQAHEDADARKEFNQKSIDELYEIKEAKGPLMKMFNALMPIGQGVSVLPILHELAPKEFIRGQAAEGLLDMDIETVEKILAAPDDDIRIYADPKLLNDALTKGSVKSVQEAGEVAADIPLVLEYTYEKEIETKVKKGSGRTKEKIKSRQTELIPLGRTQRDVQVWMDTPDKLTGSTPRQDIAQAAWNVGVGYLSGKEAQIQRRGIEGANVSQETSFVTWSKIAHPQGHPGAVAHRILSLGVDVAIIEPADFIGELKPIKNVLGIIGKTNIGKAFIKSLDNLTPTRWFMNWFDMMPEAYRLAKSETLGAKAFVASSKGTMKREFRRFMEELYSTAKKQGKKIDPLYDNKMYMNWQSWLRDGYGGSETAGHILIQDWVNRGKKLDDFFADTDNLAKYLHTTPDKLRGNLTWVDQRSLIKAWEGNILQEIQDQETRALLTHMSMKEFGASVNPDRMGYVFRDGTALDIGAVEHKAVGKLPGINPDDPIVDYMTKTKAMRYQVEGTSGSMTDITVKTAGPLTDEQVSVIIGGVRRAGKEKGRLRLLVETVDETMNLAGKNVQVFEGPGLRTFVLENPTANDVLKMFAGQTVADVAPKCADYKKMFQALDNIQSTTEAMKLEIGLINKKAVEDVDLLKQKYFAHRKAGQKTKRGVAFSSTNEQLASTKKRFYNSEDYEVALLTAGDTQEYSMLTVLAQDAEDVYAETLQHIVENNMIDQGIFRSYNSVRPLEAKQVDEAWEVVKKYRKYLDDTVEVVDDNVVDWANHLMGPETTGRVLDELDAGARVIDVIDPHKINLETVAGKDRKLWQSRYGSYFPISRMKMTLRNMSREFRTKIATAATDPKEADKIAASVQGIFDELGLIAKKTQKEMTQADVQRFVELLGNEVVKEYAPDSVLSVSKRVPIYVSDRDITNFIRSEIRTVGDPEAVKALRFIHKIQRPFMGAVTTWNPAFWRKYLMTDVFQLWKGGVSLYEIPGRVAQGGLILTGKGNTRIAGQVFNNREYLKMSEEVGVRRHIRQLMSGEQGDVLMRYTTEVLTTGKVGQSLKKVNRTVQNALSHTDDAFRLGLFSHKLNELALKGGAKTKREVMQYAREAAEWTWKHMFNYDDMPQVLKRARAFIPFLSWQYHIIPDQIKFATDVKKMKQFAKGQLSMQSMIGRPSIPMEQEYLKRSPELMWEPAPGEVYRMTTNLPLYSVLNFKSMEDSIQAMIPMLNPYLQLPLHLANLKTFPKTGRYTEYDRVPMPISMFMIYSSKGMMNSDLFQRASNLSIEIVRDKDDLETVAYFTVDKKFYDIYQTVTSVLRPIDENTKNVKVFLPIDEIKAEIYGELQDVEGMTEDAIADSIVSLQIKKAPRPRFIRTRPGLMTREVDVNANFTNQYNRLESLVGQVESDLGNIVGPGKNYESLTMVPPWEIKKKYTQMLLLYHDLQDSLEDDPQLREKVLVDLNERVDKLQSAGIDFLKIIDLIE